MAQEDSKEFKVVDRRTFQADGSRRDQESPTAQPNPQPPRIDPPVESMATREDVPDFASMGEAFPVGFETLVHYLSTTAMFQLGLLQGPSGERIPADLANARRTIDLLEVLRGKTRGNLTPAESELLEEVLYELRLSFVEVERATPP